MKHETITVTLRTPDSKQVEGFTTYCPHFAVTPSAGGGKLFSITHIQTGAKVAMGLKFREAFKVAAAIGGVMDWNGDESTLAQRFYQLPQVWQRWARSF